MKLCNTLTVFLWARWSLPVASAVTLCLLYFIPDFLTFKAELVLLGLFVFFLGLPHGALDPWIAQQSGLGHQLQHKFLFNIAYVVIAAWVIWVWHLAPVISLLLFLAASAWHFSGDWDRQFKYPAKLIFGSLLILMPIGFSTPEVATLFEYLSGPTGGAWAYRLSIPINLLLGSIGLVLAYMLYKKEWLSAISFASLALLAGLTTPLVYFTVYFCFQHSPNHLIEIFKSAPTQSYGLLRRMLIVYTLLSLIPIAVLWWFWFNLANEVQYLRIVFIGLAAVTVPHMLLLGFRKKIA